MAGPGINAVVNLGNLTIKDFDKIYSDNYLRTEPEYTKFCNVLNGNANYYRAGIVAGYGAIPDMTEGAAVPYESIKQGAEKTIRYTNIGLAAQVTLNMKEDDRSGIVAMIPAMMGKAMAYTCEVKGVDLLNSAFVTTTRSALADGKALCASHTLVDSGTAYSNLGSTSSLAETSLLALIDILENNVNEKNIPCPLKAKTLVIPVGLRWIAERLCASELRPGGMDNDVNVINGKQVNLSFTVNHYLTSSTAYFVLADKSDTDLQFVWRRKQKTMMQDDFNTESWLYRVSARLTADFFDYRGVAGNTGA